MFIKLQCFVLKLFKMVSLNYALISEREGDSGDESVSVTQENKLREFNAQMTVRIVRRLRM